MKKMVGEYTKWCKPHNCAMYKGCALWGGFHTYDNDYSIIDCIPYVMGNVVSPVDCDFFKNVSEYVIIHV